MEGIEIVITPRLLERLAYGTIIIILAVLLILKWGGGSCEETADLTTDTTTATTTTQIQAATNQTNITPTAPATSAASSACTNAVKDSSETDIDCGGSCTTKCDEFQACNLDKDCKTGLYCFQHIKCLKPSCDDAIKNQDETAVDCGGVCDGYYWQSDAKCHETAEPSGRLDVTLSVKAGVSEASGNAVLQSLTMTLENGLSTSQNLKASVYAYSEDGDSVFVDQVGDDIAIETLSIGVIPVAGKVTKTINFANSTRKTLMNVKADTAYTIAVEFKDGTKLVAKKEWTNS